MFTLQNLKKITAIVTAVIGLIVIILGATLMGKADRFSVNDDNFHYTATYYSVQDASFGADFYTYMYDASDTIVDELNDINSAISTVVAAQDAVVANTAANIKATMALTETVGKAGGMITIAIGLAVLASAIQIASTAFAPDPIKETLDNDE